MIENALLGLKIMISQKSSLKKGSLRSCIIEKAMIAVLNAMN